MNKIILILALLGLTSVTSCKKCAECSIKENNYYNGEYCTGNTLEDEIYNDAKEECEYLGGVWG
jgi:hypothetical protein